MDNQNSPKSLKEKILAVLPELETRFLLKDIVVRIEDLELKFDRLDRFLKNHNHATTEPTSVESYARKDCIPKP
jgi:CO dehydrogenase/acetyl-CoA synthase beta subunit